MRKNHLIFVRCPKTNKLFRIKCRNSLKEVSIEIVPTNDIGIEQKQLIN
jgi:hypothetical protein